MVYGRDDVAESRGANEVVGMSNSEMRNAEDEQQQQQAKRLLIARCRAMLFVRQAPVLAAWGAFGLERLRSEKHGPSGQAVLIRGFGRVAPQTGRPNTIQPPQHWGADLNSAPTNFVIHHDCSHPPRNSQAFVSTDDYSECLASHAPCPYYSLKPCKHRCSRNMASSSQPPS